MSNCQNTNCIACDQIADAKRKFVHKAAANLVLNLGKALRKQVYFRDGLLGFFR